ncbi:MAG: endonuclease [Candidatus Heimdallarchaeota archaeon]|nr:endonuclease [Candidatus Heimdallarchaeota archaeon]MCK4953987.1 endonuclease [Candidatus Heimdallarchaeota archaeon]
MRNKLLSIYNILLERYGPQNWWPGEGLEIAIGAVLTQQTNWSNVEKALEKMREAECLNIDCLKKISLQNLESLIRSSGFYRVKARRLRNLVKLLAENSFPSREDFLEVEGLGYETTDAILLYWFEEPYFVIDSYTFRICKRIGIYENHDYLELQRIFMKDIPKDIQLYKEYHALIVKHAKEFCLKKDPKCNDCSLKGNCSYNKNQMRLNNKVTAG